VAATMLHASRSASPDSDHPQLPIAGRGKLVGQHLILSLGPNLARRLRLRRVIVAPSATSPLSATPSHTTRSLTATSIARSRGSSNWSPRATVQSGDVNLYLLYVLLRRSELLRSVSVAHAHQGSRLTPRRVQRYRRASDIVGQHYCVVPELGFSAATTVIFLVTNPHRR
jgi:hypothetical protein